MVKKIAKLGESAFGQVYRAKVLNKDEFNIDADEIAVKRVFISRNVEDQTDFSDSLPEMDMLKRLKHVMICPVYCISFTNPFVNELSPLEKPKDKDEKCETVAYLCIGLAEGSLYDKYIIKSGQYKLKRYLASHSVRIIMEMCLALEYMHAQGIAHLDIKPDNILVTWESKKDEDGNPLKDPRGNDILDDPDILLGDLGFAKVPDVNHNTCSVMTDGYRPIELIDQKRDYDLMVDVWSLGCTVYFIFTGEDLFYVSSKHKTSGKIEVEYKKKIKDVLKSPTTLLKMLETKMIKDPLSDEILAGITPQMAYNFLNKMLQIEPSKRQNITQLLTDPIFESMKEAINLVRVNFPPFPIETVIFDYTDNESVRSVMINRYVDFYNEADDRIMRHAAGKNKDLRYFRLFRSIFLGLDLSERVLNHPKWGQLPLILPLPAPQGKAHKNEFKIYAALTAYICYYMALKYFPVTTVNMTEIVPDMYHSSEWLIFLTKFQEILYQDFFNGIIYRPNIYETVNKRLRGDIQKMFRLVARESSKCKGKTLEEIAKELNFPLRPRPLPELIPFYKELN